MVVKEALACGVPVVSTDVGDVADVLDGLPDCTVVEREPRAIAAAIERALDWRERQEADATRDRRRARVRDLGYDAERIARLLIGIYEEIAVTDAVPRRAGETARR